MIIMSLETAVETIHGDIRSIARFVKDTWQSSAEVTKDRITDKPLRNEWTYTDNHALNDIEEGDAFLYFGSKNSSIFRADTIIEAFSQLRDSSKGNYYRPCSEDVAKAKQTSLRLRISDLELEFDNESDNYGYIEVDTTDLTGSNLNESQRKFAEAVYGSMEQDAEGKSDYSRAMDMLNDNGNGIETVRIYTLKKETVLRDAKESAVARACRLSNFDGNSFFIANVHGVNNRNALRGVLKVGEADEQKADPLTEAYTAVCNATDRLSDAQAFGLYQILLPRITDAAKRQMTQ
ncbi:MAG: hypothetical protein KKC75_00205 [Nanoarchaeota archaeon]|nr:hypothetical protein [Nanoarchaeota archaeon]MBU1945409.1 hypothetical protein [Nanoarchaeota archaeon]